MAMPGFREYNITDDELKLFPLAALSALCFVLSLSLESQPPARAAAIKKLRPFHEAQLKVRMAQQVL